MAARGARVLATDINADALKALESDGIETAVLDLCDPTAIAALLGRSTAPDVLFNCAGFVDNGTILDCDEAAWAGSVELNVTAMYRMVRAFLPGMISAGGGSIINMASVASSIIAAPTGSSMVRPRPQ